MNPDPKNLSYSHGFGPEENHMTQFAKDFPAALTKVSSPWPLVAPMAGGRAGIAGALAAGWKGNKNAIFHKTDDNLTGAPLRAFAAVSMWRRGSFQGRVAGLRQHCVALSERQRVCARPLRPTVAIPVSLGTLNTGPRHVRLQGQRPRSKAKGWSVS